MRIRFHLLLISALLFSISASRAQTAPGPVTFNFGASDDGTLMWDLSGFYTLNFVIPQANGTALPVTVSFNMTEDPAGNLHGNAGDFQFLQLGSNSAFTVTNTISGKVTGSGGAATARFTIHMKSSGPGAVGGPNGINVNSMSALIVIDASPSLEDGALEGSAKFSARFSNGVEPVNGSIQSFTTPLPPNVTGAWSLTVTVDAFSSIVGTALLTTSTGQVLGFIASGQFNGDFNVKLRGSGGVQNSTITGAGSSATTQIDPAFDNIILSGKLMGQKFVQIIPDS